jgi:mannobiose 2-epimerase
MGQGPSLLVTVGALIVMAIFPASNPQGTISEQQYRRIKAEVEANLQKHVLSQWFPRAIDKVNGGFHEGFDEQWKQIGSPTQRSIVYQSRLTWTASQASRRTKGSESTKFKEYAQHGLDCLLDKMWDKEMGGFYWQVDAKTGQPTNGTGEKHVYGNAFGIYSSSATYSALKDKRGLDLAKRGFGWLETHSHDPINGGYYEALTREGKPILEQGGNDSIGTKYGFKSMNSHIHLLEALQALYEVWPDALVKKRFDEVFLIVRDKIYAEPGYLQLFLKPDWKNVPDHDSYGHDIETGYLLVEAAAVLRMPNDKRTWEVARKLVDHALEFGWDKEHGGFFDYGPVNGAATGRDKVWWTEAEGLNVLLLMHERYGKQTPKYWQAFLKQWEFIQKHQIDHKNGGWLSSITEAGSPFPVKPKSDQWTESYHQGRALMNVTAMLGKLAAEK